MLMVAGAGCKTLFRLQYTSKLGGLWESMDKITDRIPGDPNRDGDGRVPLASAQLSRIRMRYVEGVHGSLTNIPAVYSDVFRWLKGEPLTQLAQTPEDALGGHLAAPLPAWRRISTAVRDPRATTPAIGSSLSLIQHICAHWTANWIVTQCPTSTS